MTVVGTPLPRCPRYWGLRSGHPGRGVPTVTKCAQPYSLPRGEGGPKGRVRNSGRNLKVSTNEQTSSQVEVQEEVFRFSVIVRLPPAFLISHGTAYGGTMTASPRGKRWALRAGRFYETKNSGKHFACRCKSFCAEVVEHSFFCACRTEERIAHRGLPAYLLRRVTSWAPPSTMETEETRVSLASRIRSGMLVTPTLHMVDLTLYMEASTLSCREPA